MRINHLDLQVTDVHRSVEFFEQHFGLELQSSRSSPALAILGDGHGFVLVLQRRDVVAYPAGFHVGFLVDDVETVHAHHARAKAAGLQISDVEVNGRGTLTYCVAPDGYFVEVSCPRARAR